MKKTVLIVDPSRDFQVELRKNLELANYTVVGMVSTGEDAIQFLRINAIPDLILLEINLGQMSGLELLKYLKSFNEKSEKNIVPIVISEAIEQRREVFQYRARQFIKKEPKFIGNTSFFKNKIVSLLDMIEIQKKVKQSYAVTTSKDLKKQKIHAIAIGVSTGGPKAINQILPEMSSRLPNIPIFIIQHMPENFTDRFARNLDLKCKHRVIEVVEKTDVDNNTIYIAKGGVHMIIEKKAKIQVDTQDSPSINNCKPSVDVFLDKFAEVYGKNGLTIILTGMGHDGSLSLGKIKASGGVIFVQDEASSVVWGMPGSAVKTGFVDKVISLDMITDEIVKLIE